MIYINLTQQKATRWLEENKWFWSFVGTFLIWMVISIITGSVSLETFLSNLTFSSFLVIAALGQTIVIISGDGAIDLSTQYTITVSAFVVAYFTGNNGSIFIGVVAALSFGLFIGLCNGLITTRLQVPPIIATLAVNYIAFSGALLFRKIPMGDMNQALNTFTRFSAGGVSSLAIVAIVITGAVAFLLYSTKYGRWLHAIGQGTLAAELAGIKVKKVRTIAFVLGGLLSSVTGILLCAHFNGANVDIAVNYSLAPIAATIIGGTLISGGKSSVLGTFFGSLLFTFLVTLMTVTGFSQGYRFVVQGSVFILVLLVFEMRRVKTLS